MNTISLQPICSVEQANKPARQGGFQGTYLRSEDYSCRVTESTTGFVDKELKFVFLRNVLSPSGVQTAGKILRRLRFGNVRQSNRTFLRRSYGGEMVIGYLPSPVPRITRPTIRFPRAYIGAILPLCLTMQQLLTEHWPRAAEEQLRLASENGRWLIGSELRMFTPAIPISLYSSVTINDTVLFPSHVDSKNLSGPSCLTAFGSWTGGSLCFPRLRVAFAIQPGDVLIADTVTEQHGNIGPLGGARISVVAYLRRIG
jgi:hypothetical protein